MGEGKHNGSDTRLTDAFSASVGDSAAHERLSLMLNQSLDTESKAPIQLSGSQQTARDGKYSETQKQRRAERTRMTLDILAQAERLSQRLADQIADLEQNFAAQYGDAWREEIANRIMEPDTIPQRRAGESIEEYRERLEPALIATMIDPATGRARSKYINDPETRRYAEWAEAQYQKREVDAYIERRNDPALSDAEREALDREFADSRTGSEAMIAEDHVDASGQDTQYLREAIDQERDQQASTASAEATAFGIGTSS